MKNTLTFESSHQTKLTIATEDFGQYIADGAKNLHSLYNKVNAFFTDVKSALVSNVNTIDSMQTKLESKQYKDFIKLIEKYDFDFLKELRCYRPENLNVTYSEYLVILKQSTECAIELETTVSELNLIVNKLLGIKNYNKSIVNDFKKFEKNIKTINDINTKYKKAFNSDSKSMCTVKDVFNSKEDILDCLKEIETVTKELQSIDKEKIQKNIRNICLNIDILLDRNTNEDMQISPELLKTISTATLNTAEQIEHYTVVYFKLLQVSGSIDNSIKTITDIVNK